MLRAASDAELRAIWDANDMNRKRQSGLFTEIIASVKPARDPARSGVRAVYVKLLTASGKHIGTVRDLIGPEGTVIETQVRDYPLRECSRLRRLHTKEEGAGR